MRTGQQTILYVNLGTGLYWKQLGNQTNMNNNRPETPSTHRFHLRIQICRDKPFSHIILTIFHNYDFSSAPLLSILSLYIDCTIIAATFTLQVPFQEIIIAIICSDLVKQIYIVYCCDDGYLFSTELYGGKITVGRAGMVDKAGEVTCIRIPCYQKSQRWMIRTK